MKLVATLLIVFAGSSPVMADEADGVRDMLLGRTVVFKIEMPVVKGVQLSPDGRLDEKTYSKRLKKHPSAFMPGGRAEITEVRVEKDELKICFNNCGIGFVAPGSRIVGNLEKKGSALIISFPGTVTADQLDPGHILAVMGGVVTVEGVTPPVAAPAPSSPASSPSAAVDPSVELLSVTVEPAEVSIGDTVRLVIQFEVEGAGAGVPLTEERQLFLNGSPLLSAPRSTTETWHDGRQRTVVEFDIPASAAVGAYTFEATLRGAGTELRGRAVFLVQ